MKSREHEKTTENEKEEKSLNFKDYKLLFKIEIGSTKCE